MKPMKNKRIISLILSLALIVTAVFQPSLSTYAANEYNYAKLLQYSLYLYDANMCGGDVDGKCILDWRHNCHTDDKTTYTRRDGQTVQMDLTGGFHDAGDHVKFGITIAYAAFTLGMSYNVYPTAFQKSEQTGHLQNLTTFACDYMVKCIVPDAAGNVEAFCVQVGDGNQDHSYWGAPENQTGSRPILFSSESNPATDVVCLSAAALIMQYMNFGGDKYRDAAIKLFKYADNMPKGSNTAGNGFYNSYDNSWEDDYCLAALLLYNSTKDEYFKQRFDSVISNSNSEKPYWPFGYANVGPAVSYYRGNSDALYTLQNQMSGKTKINGYLVVSDWGSNRYNTSLQFTGLLFDRMTSSNTYGGWAEGQMRYILGENSDNRCYVVGYNNGVRYPHHRAASGYLYSSQGTTTQAHQLLGALVGGPKESGYYVDTADDFVCNEVAIDYNATLVAAAAALYEKHISEAGQTIDPSKYSDKNTVKDPEPYYDVPGWPFTDVNPVETNWAYGPVKYVYEMGFMTGYNKTDPNSDKTKFGMGDSIKRCDFVCILYKMMKMPAPSSTHYFPDVDQNKYYYSAVQWAYSNQIIKGYDNGNFGPNDPVTREQIAVMLRGFAAYRGKNTNDIAELNGFEDFTKVSAWAGDGVKWAVGAGMIAGRNVTDASGRKTVWLAPKDNAKREEVAAIIMRYYNKFGI